METIGEKIKAIRKQKGITLQQLSDIAHFSKGYLSKIETSDSAPRLPTLQQIAHALDVEMDVFLDSRKDSGKNGIPTVETDPDSANIDIVHRSEEPEEERFTSDSGYSYVSLLHRFRGKYMNPYLLRIPRGETERFTHDSEEFFYMVRGAVEFHYEGRIYALRAGDSLYFDSRLPHRIVNKTDEAAEIINVVFDYKRF